MRDQILESYVESFRDSESYGQLEIDEVFERFVNYCVVSRQYPKREFNVDSLSVGGGNDTGFDGVSIMVNGAVVRSPEEVEYLCSQNQVLSVSFTFIQSKNSARFRGDQVGTFLFGIKNFFDKVSSVPENDDIRELRATKDKIYQNSINFEEAPALRMYFATTGEWNDPEAISGRADRELADLRAKKLFSSIGLEFYDADRLKEAYRELRRKTVKEIDFPNHVALPEIAHVRQSFIGSLAAAEYIRLISDSEGRLQKSLFEDNVRDFQGSNKVNDEIGATLRDEGLQAALAILNNGITIIAKRVDPVGTKLKLTDFQVVNGCQSSHVLYENRAELKPGTHIVLRVIETTDQDLSSKVIRATNKQTIIVDEAFESLAPFHKELEEFYKAHSKIPHAIFYERRSRQYQGDTTVAASQIMTLTSQINAYVATTLAQPHSTHRYYGELLDAYRGRMFREGDSKDGYFISCLAYNRIERMFRAGEIDPKLRSFKYQMLYLAHSYHEYLKARKNGYGFKELLAHYCDAGQYRPVLLAVADVVSEQLRSFSGSRREAERSRDFTAALKGAFEGALASRRTAAK